MSGSKPLPDRGDPNRSSALLQVEISKVFVSGVNVRRSPGDVVDLMKSIGEEGILEPLLVRPVDGRYELIVGSRRFEAGKRKGMKEVTAVVRTLGDEDALIISLVENIQRRDVEPEEEYEALMKLKKLNPALYSTTDQLAEAIGKSRQYVEDRVAAVEAVNTIRRGTKSAIAVRQSPTMEERKEGVLPISHAGFLHKAEEAPAVQELSEEKRAKRLSALADTIAELPASEARRVVEQFVKDPRMPMDEIKRTTEALRGSKIEVVLDPQVAAGLRKVAEEREMTVEAVAALAIRAWLRLNKYV